MCIYWGHRCTATTVTFVNTHTHTYTHIRTHTHMQGMDSHQMKKHGSKHETTRVRMLSFLPLCFIDSICSLSPLICNAPT